MRLSELKEKSVGNKLSNEDFGNLLGEFGINLSDEKLSDRFKGKKIEVKLQGLTLNEEKHSTIYNNIMIYAELLKLKPSNITIDRFGEILKECGFKYKSTNPNLGILKERVSNHKDITIAKNNLKFAKLYKSQAIEYIRVKEKQKTNTNNDEKVSKDEELLNNGINDMKEGFNNTSKDDIKTMNGSSIKGFGYTKNNIAVGIEQIKVNRYDKKLRKKYEEYDKLAQKNKGLHSKFYKQINSEKMKKLEDKIKELQHKQAYAQLVQKQLINKNILTYIEKKNIQLDRIAMLNKASNKVKEAVSKLSNNNAQEQTEENAHTK